MQILITHSRLAHSRVLQFSRWQLVLGAMALAVTLVLVSGAVYHFVFMAAAREQWPVVGQVVRWVMRDDLARQERYMRENLDAMAQRVGEMQAKLLKLQVMGERVSGLAGIKPEDLLPPGTAASGARGARGGPYRPVPSTASALAEALTEFDAQASLNADIFTFVESKLLASRLQALMVPSSRPVEGPVGSGFGFREDPFTGRSALHTGLDYPAPEGTPIVAAAGGVVASTETHPEYGRLVVVDHGNGLSTRYAHTSRILVQPGDLVRRDQVVAEVGSTGRSTGAHLHFEVLLDGVPQNPSRFLRAADKAR